MHRGKFVEILEGIKNNFNNVSVIENFRNKALVTIRTPAIVVESKVRQRVFRQVLDNCTNYSIRPESNELTITLEFDLQ
ncbi:MAG TPA: hypothetical protein PKA10_20295 [Selenomonadales bacterium]|nr:hypothetical protein [Selenomonadales bacterium]